MSPNLFHPPFFCWNNITGSGFSPFVYAECIDVGLSATSECIDVSSLGHWAMFLSLQSGSREI